MYQHAKAEIMTVFHTSVYDHQMDSKNRIRISSKLKGEEKGLYFTKGADRCIFVYTKPGFDELVEKLNVKLKEKAQSGKVSVADLRMAVRVFAKSFVFIEGDSQGRMILPSKLKEYAQIGRDVKICGMGSRIEIWSKDNYNKVFANEDENYNAILDELEIY